MIEHILRPMDADFFQARTEWETGSCRCRFQLESLESVGPSWSPVMIAVVLEEPSLVSRGCYSSPYDDTTCQDATSRFQWTRGEENVASWVQMPPSKKRKGLCRDFIAASQGVIVSVLFGKAPNSENGLLPTAAHRLPSLHSSANAWEPVYTTSTATVNTLLIGLSGKNTLRCPRTAGIRAGFAIKPD